MVYTRNPIGLSVVVLALMMGAASGQGLTDKGVKLGLNLANVGGEFLDDVDPIMKLGFALGGYATLDFDLPVVIQPEALFSQKGYQLDVEDGFFGETIKQTVTVNYIDINALVVFPLNDQIHVFGGPSFGLFIGGQLKTEFAGTTEETDIKSEDMNGMDLGLIVGAGYQLGTISVEARYSLGLKQAYKEREYNGTGTREVLDIKNNVIQVMVGYAL